jgi:hypothetical protein
LAAFDSKKRISPVGGYYNIVIATHAFTGSVVDLDTGLAQIVVAVGIPKIAAQAAADPAYVTCNFGGDGLLDAYAWDDAGAAAANAGTIMFIIVGY